MIVVIDANVLFKRLQRNILLCLADVGYFTPYWNRRILNETARNLVQRNRMSGIKSKQIIKRINISFPNSQVKSRKYTTVSNRYVNKINQKDKHVAKTAICVSASGIITEDQNFQNELIRQGLNYFTPDDFIARIINSNGITTIPAIKKAKSLVNPTLSGIQFIGALLLQFGMNKTAAALNPYRQIL